MANDKQTGQLLQFIPTRDRNSSRVTASQPNNSQQTKSGPTDSSRQVLIEKLRRGGFIDLKRE